VNVAEQFITCPHCHNKILLNEALTTDIEKKIRSEYEVEVLEKEENFNKREREIKKKEKEIQELKSSIDDEVREKVEEREKALKGLEKELKKSKAAVEEEVEERISQREKELAEREKELKKSEASIDKEVAIKVKIREEEIGEREKELEKARAAVDKEIDMRLETEKKKLTEEARKKAESDYTVEIKDLSESNKELESRLKNAQEKELKIRKQQRELEASKKQLELDVARKMDEERDAIRNETERRLREEHRLKDREKDKTLEDMKSQIEELRRRSEQSSQQLKGEVMELELEDVLKDNFPDDNIEPVKKGAKGADVLQHVKSEMGKESGIIVWESKRTKRWSNSWIQKVKDDKRKVKGDIAVIVTETLPAEVDNFSIVQGVWICDFGSAIGLATALRIGLIEVTRTKAATVGKSKKIEAIYDYLSGPEFQQRVEAVVEAFIAMRGDLEQEKRALISQWAKREKQIEKVVSNMAGLYGDMQGIIGATLPEIEGLQLKALTSGDKNNAT